MNKTKKCPRCGKIKPLNADNYHRDKNASSGFRSHCKECRSKYRNHNIFKDIFTKEFLLTEFLEKEKDPDQIAEEISKEYGKRCYRSTVSTWLRRHGITIRSAKNTFEPLDVKGIVNRIPQIEMNEIELFPITTNPEKENINLIISDLHVGQKLFNETEEAAMTYFNKAFKLLKDNIIKTLSHLRYDWQELNLFLLGDLVEGEGIYPNQAYETFQIMRQLKIAEQGLLDIILGIKSLFDIKVNIICVRGNHGRIKAFASEEGNWDTILFELLERSLQNFDDIIFHRTDFWMKDFVDQWNNKYLVTHGDAIKGGTPSYNSIKDAVQSWHVGFDGFDAFLCGHFHHSTSQTFGRIEVLTNGCFRFNDFPIRNSKINPDMHFWLFGSGKNRPITWKYKIDTEPIEYRDSLEHNMKYRRFK